MKQAGGNRSGHSDDEAFSRVARESIARVVSFVGADAPGITLRAIDTVRALTDPGYTVGDAQIDQQLAAGSSADTRLAESVSHLDEVDRATVLTAATRLLARQGEITEAGAELLEHLGRLLELDDAQVEYLVVGALSADDAA